jgi:hypothetical protein
MVQFATVFASLLDRETPGPAGSTQEESHLRAARLRRVEATQKPN